MCPLYGGRLWFKCSCGTWKKVSALWSARFRVSALERFCYNRFLRNSSGTKLKEESAIKTPNLKFRLETHIVLENTSTSAKGFVECDTGIKTSGSFKCIKYRKIEYDITFCHHGVCFIFWQDRIASFIQYLGTGLKK